MSVDRIGSLRSGTAKHWLDNLLPEGRNRAGAALYLEIPENDIERLLERLGGDTAGASTFGTALEPPGYRSLSAVELEEMLDIVNRHPVVDDVYRCCVAGAMPKLCVQAEDNGTIHLPLNGAVSTHILKPDIPERLWGICHNEAFCMSLARRLGLHVASVTTGRAGGHRSYLMVRRYDRAWTEDGWQRLHQEDFCQAVGRPSDEKYEVTLSDMFAVARAYNLPDKDLRALWDAVVYNVMIGNTDAHAKQFSILLNREPRLAPLYDLVCCTVFPNVSKTMAMKISGQARGEYVFGRYWRRQAEALGVEDVVEDVLGRVEELATRTIDLLPEVRQEVEDLPAGGHPNLDQVVAEIERRSRRILGNLSK